MINAAQCELETLRSRNVSLIQLGARRNYVYAQQLEASGLLDKLLCDAAWPANQQGLMASLVKSFPKLRGGFRRRQVHSVPASRIYANVFPNILELSKKLIHDVHADWLINIGMHTSLRVKGVKPSKVIVNYLGNGGGYLNYAKKKGSIIITDFIITPKYLEIERQEHRRWPDWENTQNLDKPAKKYRAKIIELLRISDIYLCPSQTVADHLSDLPEFDESRVRIVPYGLSGVLKRTPEPIAGRVLFAGAAGLRKGIPYLAKAAQILKTRNPNIQIVIAGKSTDHIRSKPEMQALEFLGVLNREQMADEFAKADIFCLPSLAEGSATVIFEAMAFGLPIVTTPSSGSVIRDGKEGYLVGERDAETLADAIEKIINMRTLRQNMSAESLKTSELYSDIKCGELFIKVVTDVLKGFDTTSNPSGT